MLSFFRGIVACIPQCFSHHSCNMISTRAATEQILAYKGIQPPPPNKKKKSIARGKPSSSLKSYTRRQVTAAG